MKRLIDILGSSLLLSISLPIIICIACVSKKKLGTPIIFKQIRPGLYGKPFALYKFRTMTNQVGADGNLLSDEIRLTSYGQFLRKYSLDELPQLFNVFKGDLSLVGPRPLLMEYLPLYTEKQSKRHMVKPGITGWAQVNGRNAIDWNGKLNFDIWYVENYSIWLDLKIVILTIEKVLKSEGINQPGHVSTEAFKGSQSHAKEGKS